MTLQKIKKLKIGESRIIAEHSEAPHGAKVMFGDKPFTKGTAVWIADHKSEDGFRIHVPNDKYNAKEYQALEKAWHGSQKELTPEQSLKILKAPSSQKQALMDKFRSQN